MRALYGLVMVAMLLVLAVPSGLDSCAISPPVAVFVASQGPADRGEFLRGKVSAVLDSYSQRDLVAAFRVLSGVPLSEAEVAALYPRPEQTSGYPVAAPISEPWIEARRLIPGVQPIAHLQPYKTVSTNGQMVSFLNCQRDAFLTATTTQASLIATWGVADPRTAEWVKAQDQVFANCDGTTITIPPEPNGAMDPLLAAHRRYQIAAADFYAGHFREAWGRFRRIAGEPDSPWHEIAPYLAARALLRAGLMDGDRPAFEQGKEGLQAILKDPAQARWHDSSLALLHLWQVRVEPQKRLIELGQTLQQPREVAAAQDAIDFLYLMDPKREPAPGMADVQESELASWVLAMSRPPKDAASVSMTWWRKERRPVWLVAALRNANGADMPELVRAARRVPADSPAWESANYYGIAGEIRAGHVEEGRQWADRMLAGKLSRSTRNLLLALRLPIARNWSEFLRFAPRQREAGVVEFEDKEVPAWENSLPTGVAPTLIQDSTQILNAQVPLSLWKDAVRNPILPASIQLRLTFAGWLRAVMLEPYEDAQFFLRRAVELQPESAAAAKDFLEARTDAEARFAAVRLVLRAPSVCPSVPGEGFATTNLAQKHSLFTFGWIRTSCWIQGPSQKQDQAAGFLSAEQIAEGKKESARIYGQESWEATLLLRECINWAEKHGDDPRVPEALHDAVIASKYRVTDSNTGKYSKQASISASYCTSF